MIILDLVPFDSGGFIDPQDVAKAFRPETGLVILTHASNVLGTIQPIEEIGRICYKRNVPLVVDVSQSAGVGAYRYDGMAFGRYCVYRTQIFVRAYGQGGLLLRDGLDVTATRFGGTGVD